MIAQYDQHLPGPLRDWLQGWRTAKAKAAESGAALTPEMVRAFLAQLPDRFISQSPDMGLVCDGAVTTPARPVPIRVYHPRPDHPLPVLLFLHGGGHMAGSVPMYDPIARKLARATERVVVSAEYRLAPEHPYPAGLEDSLACTRGLFDTLQSLRIPFLPRLALAGDSAGAALCATLAQRCQPPVTPRIEGQVLLYPSLDYTLSQPSVTRYGSGYLLESDRIQWMFDAYLPPGEDRRHLSPLFLPLHPCYPTTLIIAAEFDPLHDEAVAFAGRLRRHGIPCALHDMPGMIHAYLYLEDLVPELCGETYARIGTFLAAIGAD